MVRFRRNKKEENYTDDFDEDFTDDEVDTLIMLALLDNAPDCSGCAGDAGCC